MAYNPLLQLADIWHLSMVIEVVLEEQFSCRQRADNCKTTNLPGKKVLESGKHVAGIHIGWDTGEEGGGIGKNTSLGLLIVSSHTQS